MFPPGLKRGLLGRVWRREVPEHMRWERSEKDGKGFTGSDVGQVMNWVLSDVFGKMWRKDEVAFHRLDWLLKDTS